VITKIHDAVNFIPEITLLCSRIKKNTRQGLMSYMLYDFTNIKPESKYVLKTRDPLNPENLIPSNMDQTVLGKKYSQSDVLSTIMTQLARYSKEKSIDVSPGWRRIRDKVRAKFISRFFRTDKLPQVTNADIAKHLNPVIAKMKANGGVFQDLNLALRPLDQTYTIHFFLKDVTKCVMAKTNDADKCGQGISAWSKTLNALFCPIFRAIEEKFKSCLKENVIYENGTSEEEFDYKVASCFDHDLKQFVNDFKQFDESQDADTQFLEDVVLEMFIGPKFLHGYRQMRLKAKQKSVALSLMNKGCKNSGESATLFTNTIVNMFYVCLTTKVKGVACEGYKGDDSFINALAIELCNQVYLLDPDVHLPMKSDIDFPLHTDFVSYYLSEFGIIPDVLKIVNKLLSKEFDRKVGYIQELRESIEDKTKFLNYRKLVYLRRIYYDTYGMSEEQFDQLMCTWHYLRKKLELGDNRVMFSALVVGETYHGYDDQTEAMKNQKRVKQFYGDTSISI
jgi:hypothetical protein